MNKFAPVGVVKEVVGSITTPEHARLAIILLPSSINEERVSDVQKKVIARWMKVKQDYRERFVIGHDFKLGVNIFTPVASDIWICQALCLNDKGRMEKEALKTSVKNLVDTAKYERAHIHVSNLSLAAHPTLKKALGPAAVEAGLNLYCYTDAPTLVKR